MIEPGFKTVKKENIYDYYLWVSHNGVLVEKLFCSTEKELSKETLDLYKSIIRVSFKSFNELLLKSIFDFDYVCRNVHLLLEEPENEYKVGDLVCIKDTKHLGRVIDLAADNFLKLKLLVNTHHSSSYSYNINLVKPYTDNDICVNTFVRYTKPDNTKYICLVNRYNKINDKYDITIIDQNHSLMVGKECLENLDISKYNYRVPVIAKVKDVVTYYVLVLANIDDGMEYICYNNCLQTFKSSEIEIITNNNIISELVYLSGTRNLKYNRCIGYKLLEENSMYLLDFGNISHKYKKEYCRSIDDMFTQHSIIDI